MRELAKDRVGLGWRPELSGAIALNLDAIDVVEVIAEDLFEARTARLRAMRRLAEQVPLTLHGVSAGLASTVQVDRRRLERLARVVEAIQPESWSEHLAFVRAGGIEIWHLAAPPRTEATLEGARRNVESARAVVGTTPLLENVASLLDPPGSQMSEAAWLASVPAATGCSLLLDLHNLHANAVNFGFDAREVLAAVATRVSSVHIAGGRWIEHGGARRLLDDHLHAVPPEVYALLEELAATAAQPLTVILERDGKYPPLDILLAELAAARAALVRGRERNPSSGRVPS